MKPENFRDLMRLVHGFEAAKILLVANDLGLFRRLDRERVANELAIELDVDPRALELLMNALTALGLLEKSAAGFRNAPVAAAYLAGDSYRGHIFRHIHHSRGTTARGWSAGAVPTWCASRSSSTTNRSGTAISSAAWMT